MSGHQNNLSHKWLEVERVYLWLLPRSYLFLTSFPGNPQLDTIRLQDLAFPKLTLAQPSLQNVLRLRNSCLQNKSDIATSKLSKPDTNTSNIQSGLWMPWQSLYCWGSKVDYWCPTEPHMQANTPNTQKNWCHQWAEFLQRCWLTSGQGKAFTIRKMHCTTY